MNREKRVINQPPLDFNRDVWSLLGIPVDNLTIASTKNLLRDHIRKGGKNLILSTINVNWIVQSLSDVFFYQAVLNSDIVTLDGKPLVWLARLLGYPMAEVVAGSSLIEDFYMENEPERPLSIFLFGGESGVAEKAMNRINNSSSGLKAVGALNPGFGTIQQMSSDSIINEINRARPDILLVALGAKKGTQWIEYNRHRLKARIISHLGATINFLAGTVPRAPKNFRKMGLEWVWRIYQEPNLFIRYAKDGIFFLSLLARNAHLFFYFLYLKKKFDNIDPEPIRYCRKTGTAVTIVIGRNAQSVNNDAVKKKIWECTCLHKDIIIDFQEAHFIGGDTAGLLMLLEKYQQKIGRKLIFINLQGRIKRILSLFLSTNQTLWIRS